MQLEIEKHSGGLLRGDEVHDPRTAAHEKFEPDFKHAHAVPQQLDPAFGLVLGVDIQRENDVISG